MLRNDFALSPSPLMSILSKTLLVKSSAVTSWFSLPVMARMAWGNKQPHDQSLPFVFLVIILQDPAKWVLPLLGSNLDDVEQLVSVDAAVAVHVVELEVPAQLVLHLAAHHQAERRHVLHEVDVAVLRAPFLLTWDGDNNAARIWRSLFAKSLKQLCPFWGFSLRSFRNATNEIQNP